MNADSVFGDCKKEAGAPLQSYIEAERKILQDFGVDYLDLTKDFSPRDKGWEEFFADGLHPNDHGHTLLADKICEYVLQKSK